MVFTFLVLIRIHHIIQYLQEQKRRREFKNFEEAISGANPDPNAARKYFSGEIKLPEDIYVIIPKSIDSEDRKSRFEIPIHDALVQAGIGEVVRGFEVDETCGFDIYVNDFVAGVDLVRKQLIKLEAPAGTLIEYSGGDLAIYDLN